MKKLISTIFSIYLLIACYAQTHHEDYLDGVVYLKVEESVVPTLIPYDESDLVFNQIIDDYGIYSILQPFTGIGSDTLDATYKLHFSDTAGVDNLINELNGLLWVDYCEKAPLYRTFFVPNDAHTNQWYLSKVEAFDGWNYSMGSTEVTIAIVDNAVRTTHQDLVANLWVNPNEEINGFDSDLNGYADDINGYDVADGDNNPNPPTGFTGGAFSHGTHCAGIASASTNNSIGVAGIGFNCKIISVKCSRDSGDGLTLPFAYEGLQYAISTDADIISMSWGGRVTSFTGEALINTAVLNGIVLLAAAGNDNEENLLSPADHPSVIAVGATNQQDQRASFSNYGENIDFMAPGVSIYNTLGGSNSDYGYNSGTSMSCPLVAGIAGLLLSEFPAMSPADVRQKIREGCDFIDDLNPGYEGKLGAGRVNIGKMFQPLSLEELPISTNPIVYPNPAREHVFINLGSSDFSKENMHVVDMMGKNVSAVVEIDFVSESVVKLSRLGKLQSGVYFLHFPQSELPIFRLIVQ